MIVTYDRINEEVKKFATDYRKKHEVPALPDETELKPFKEILYSKYSKVVELVKIHLEGKESTVTHGFPHLEHVASLAGYIADNEIASTSSLNMGSTPNEWEGVEPRGKVVETTLLSGFLHDIDRHLGFGEIHAEAGEKSAKNILAEAEINNPLIPIVVRNHDKLDFDTGKDIVLTISYGSVFDADHFMYGWERENIFWERGEKRGTPPDEIIHDYKFLPPYRNVWKTRYGKKIGTKFIDFGLAIAEYIETTFR